MDYNQIYFNTFNHHIKIAEKLLKKNSKTLKNNGFSFKYSYGFLSDEISIYKDHIYKIFSYENKLELFRIFKNRNKIFESDPINLIVQHKMIPFLKKNDVLREIDLEHLIKSIAKYEAVRTSGRLFQNNNQLYQLMYDLNNFSKLELKSYGTSVRNTAIYKKLHSKLFPTPKSSKTKIVKSKSSEDEFLNVNEVAELVNYAVPTIYDLKHKGKIPFYKNGAKLQFKKSEILEWMENGKGITKSDIEEKANEYLLKNKF
ncbi:helix-turn-helix domain-containing protein [Lutibacter sp. TH_r2]|uniref:helix-turn-helix domain-containing protein n=1 Tax=Lutibacter sp. TH_r2 TaxID=3082083 RepID=UPI002952CC17|nr:helix-turn-helix domain-containing protein [Lutibacter sp. TH_r2]MDV7187430.1 helix-turn-helix domain-containing protein [Lutibacter sp. TH_r2]